MPEMITYIGCGLTAGLLAGYLGLGGGIIIVPFLTVVAGMDIKAAVPVSVTAITVNAFSASNEYLKRGMVDLELVVMLAVFMMMGNISGSLLSNVISADYTKLVLTVVLIYTAFSLLKGKNNKEQMNYHDNRGKYLLICTTLAFATGILSGLVGIGGGVIIVPVLFLIIGLPLTTARGTSSLMIGFSAAASTVVFFISGQVNLEAASGVVLGIMIGGRLGGFLGTMAKPIVVKILFFIIMLFLAYKLSYEPLRELYGRF